MTDTTETPTTCDVIFNGACPVCAAGIDVLKTTEDGVEYTDIAATPEKLDALGLTAEDVQYRLHAVGPDGTLRRGIDAVAESLKSHRRWRWAGRLATLPVLRQIGWVLYELTAALLFRWNKWKGNF
ncbi:MAG: DUF393 domain-containing protein [Pseudomonadota bacterium]